MTKWYQSPLVWSTIIVGVFSSYYYADKPEWAPIEGTPCPSPITRRMRVHDSITQLRMNGLIPTGHRRKASNTTILYETEVYINGKWIKVQQVRIKGLPQQDERDIDEVWDEMEGK